MSNYTENLIESLREHWIEEISNIFDNHSKKDNLGDTSIQALDLSDESIYLIIDNEPEYNDVIDGEVIYLGELVEFWDNLGEICVRTFEYGSKSIVELPTEALLKCYDCLSVLENKDNETK